MSLYRFLRPAFLAAVALLYGCGGGGDRSAPDMGDDNRAPSHVTIFTASGQQSRVESVKVAPTITVGTDTHVIQFAIHEGRLWTLEPPTGNQGYGGLAWSEVAEVRWNSVRSGSGAGSVARSIPAADGKVTLPHTPNNDRSGVWSVVDKQGGVWYLRARQWFQVGLPVTVNADYSVSYGSYREPRIDLMVEGGQRFVRVHFGANVITGVYPTVFREEIAQFRWNTRNQDWNDPAVGIMSPVKTDSVGDYYVDLGGIPTPVDLGGISAVLSRPKPDGTRIVYLDQALVGFMVGTGIRVVVDEFGQRFIELKFPS